MYRDRYFRPNILKALGTIEPAVKKHNLTLVETALRWVLHHSKLNTDRIKGGNDGIILGVSSLKQLEGNIKDCEKGPLPEEIVAVIEEAWESLKGDHPAYWR